MKIIPVDILYLLPEPGTIHSIELLLLDPIADLIVYVLLLEELIMIVTDKSDISFFFYS